MGYDEIRPEATQRLDYGLNDVGNSRIGILAFVVVVAAMLFAFIGGEKAGTFGALVGSMWWLKIEAAVVAILVMLVMVGDRLY